MNRLSSINVGASSEVSKLVKSSAKDIAKRFYKAMSKGEQQKAVDKRKVDVVKTKKVDPSPKKKRSVKQVKAKSNTAVKTKAKTKRQTKSKK